MKISINKAEILAAKNRLEEAANILKSEFIGLDEIIDEVIALIMPWYLFPDAQMRPTIVNLWGMTGSGKTALVKRLSELIGFDKAYVQVDMGELSDNSEMWLKTMLSQDLYHHNKRPVILSLDEFQFARTVDQNGTELDRNKLRIVWEILDSGQFWYTKKGGRYFLNACFILLELLESCHSEGVGLINGVISHNVEAFNRIFKGFEFPYYYKKRISPKFFISNNFVGLIHSLMGESFRTKREAKEHIRTLDIMGLRDLILDGILTDGSMKHMDLSQALIFVIGNLDEAFYMSSNISADIQADAFHELTQKINISDIKAGLQKRFRNEQIARLGNNHVIYPSFKEEHFRELIQRQLDLVKQFVKDRFDLELAFTDSVEEILYREGVVPTQGIRPVFTTVKMYIESYVSRIVAHIFSNAFEVHHIEWDCIDLKKFEIRLIDGNGQVLDRLEYVLKLKVDHLRRARNDDVQAHTAIHEAGHAILAALELHIIPETIVSQTADHDAAGFVRIRLPERMGTRELIRKQIIIGLGGMIAERLVFGDEHTSTGVASDIQKASRLANTAIRNYAMGSDPIALRVEEVDGHGSFVHQERYESEALELIRDCETKAEALLSRNQLLLLKMGEYLTSHSRMDKDQIEQMIREYSVEAWVRSEGFIEPEAYFRYKDIIQERLARLEVKIKG